MEKWLIAWLQLTSNSYKNGTCSTTFRASEFLVIYKPDQYSRYFLFSWFSLTSFWLTYLVSNQMKWTYKTIFTIQLLLCQIFKHRSQLETRHLQETKQYYCSNNNNNEGALGARGAKPFQFHVKRIISMYNYWENCISTYLTSMKYPMNHRSLTSKSLMPATPSAMNEDVVLNVSNYSWNHHSHDPFKFPWLFPDFSQHF